MTFELKFHRSTGIIALGTIDAPIVDGQVTLHVIDLVVRGGLVSGAAESRDKSTLARNLTLFMTRANLSLTQLSARSAVPKPTVHRWLTGKSVSPYHRSGLLAMAAVLELPKFEVNKLLQSAGLPVVRAGDESVDILDVSIQPRWNTRASNNLPSSITSFVGREEEIAEVAELLLEGSIRLVTVTGTGGSGKTRLALMTAEELLDAFPDGVYFVPLVAVSDPSLVLQTIAEAVGLRDVLDVSAHSRLVGWLERRQVLLLLDNLEQIVECGPSLAELLRKVPGVKLLVTSRVPLHVSGEYVVQLGPLPLPEPNELATRVRERAAIALFIERARAVNGMDDIDRHDLSLVVELCTRLEGLPLGIELAAARTRERHLSELIHDFPKQLDLAAQGPVDVPGRHRTLRSAIAWSVDLLREPSRSMMLRASIFSGGWTQEAACEVCGYDRVDAGDVGPILDELVNAHLVVKSESAASANRYRMLEMIREYGIEQLQGSGEEAAIRDRHADYFLCLAESAPTYVPETRSTGWFERVDEEVDNVRSALDWLDASGQYSSLARFAASLWPYWNDCLRPKEGARWLDQILAMDETLPDLVLGSILTGACTLACTRTDYETGRRFGEQALHVWRQLGDHHGQALVLRQLGWASYMSGSADESVALFQSALEEWRFTGIDLGVVSATSDLGLTLCVVGRAEDATTYLERAGSAFARLGDEHGIARSSRDRGLLYVLTGDLELAVPTLKEAVQRFQAIGRTSLLASAQYYLGLALAIAGRADDAIVPLSESLRMHEEIGDLAHLSLTILGLAAVAYRQDDAVRSATLCGIAESMRRGRGILLPRAGVRLYERELAAIKAMISEETFNQAFAFGATMTHIEALSYARAPFSMN